MEKDTYRLFPSFRIVVIILVATGVMNMTLSANVLGFTLVCMVNSSAVEQKVPIVSACGTNETVQDAAEMYSGTFLWTKEEQASLLASVNWAAVWLLIPAGWTLDRFGAKWLSVGMNVVCGLGMLLTPVAAVSGGVWAVFAVRFIQGLLGSFQAVVLMRVVTRWATPKETGLCIAVGMLGFPLGNVLLLGSSGFLCSSRFGWPSVFYVYGTLILLWVVIWIAMFEDDPKDSRFTSAAEKAYIHSNMPESLGGTRFSAPWKRIVKSPAVWASYAATISFGWGAYLYPLFIPTFLKESIHVGQQSNGEISSLPFIAQVIGRLLASGVNQILEERNIVTRTNSMKIWNSLSLAGTAIVCVALGFLDCSQVVAVAVLLGVFQMSVGFIALGVFRSYVLIAPRYCGILSAVGQLLEFLAVAIMSYSIGFATENGTREEWRTALIISAVVILVGGAVFLVFGSGKEEKWASEKPAAVKDKS